MNLLQTLRDAFRAAAPEGSDPDAFASAVRPSNDPKFGDYQANGCMAIAKRQKLNPETLARQVAEAVDLSPLADRPEVARGFVNVRLRDDWIAAALGELLTDDRLGLRPSEEPLTVVVDFSSPNVAKPMHVGHIRSITIGNALAELFEALGHRVIRDNHLGDWGTQFGMILRAWKREGDEAAYETDPVGELARLYKGEQATIRRGEQLAEKFAKPLRLQAEGKADEAEALFQKLGGGNDFAPDLVTVLARIAEGRETAEAARAETAALHEGDPTNRALWSRFMPACLAALDLIYQRLGIRFDHQLGESHYDPMLPAVVADLEAKGLAETSEGALIVPVRATPAPFLIRKRDGAYNYATTDLATIKYRVEHWDPDLILYVVDTRQSDHFKALFEVARRWGFDRPDYQHVAFGAILGNDRRPIKTRSGDSIGLESLLDESVVRARKVVDANSPDLPDSERAEVAETVGLSAIKYADLAQNRLSDYVFDWDRMLALQGNTATYLQYAYARVASIFRKGEVDPEALRTTKPAIRLGEPAERALGLHLLRMPEAIEQAAFDLKPNIWTDYLYGLAEAFSTFFEVCPVLKAPDPETRSSRLAVCDLTARTLKFGLARLSIPIVERM